MYEQFNFRKYRRNPIYLKRNTERNGRVERSRFSKYDNGCERKLYVLRIIKRQLRCYPYAASRRISSISKRHDIGTNVSGINFSELGVVTGTVATMAYTATDPNFAGQPTSVLYTGAILFAPNTVVFFNNTGVIPSSAIPTVGATVQFDFAQVYTGVNGVGVPINPKYIGEAVNIFVTS